MATMKKVIRFYIPLLAAVVLVGFGVSSTLQCRQNRKLEAKSREVRQEIQEADAVLDDEQAILLYTKIAPPLPEVELRILQRQWSMALEILRQVRRIRYNPLLENDVSVLYGRLRDHLEAMKERCGALLADSGSISPDVAWRAYNLEGSVKLLYALAVLETERNPKKVGAIMREAISHLKAAIEAVDKAPSAGLQRNIPRWNLELLHGEQMVERFQLAEPDVQRQLDLKDNLEAILPEQGGYAPGESIDRKIRK